MFRSLKALKGYTVEGINGEAGQVYDVYFDDRDWHVRHIVVAAGNATDQSRTLLAPISCTTIDKKCKRVYVLLTKEQLAGYCLDDSAAPPVSRQHQSGVWGDPYLRSVKEVLTYRALTRAGSEAGKVCDFIFNDQTWQITAIAVGTANGLIRARPEQVFSVNWRMRAVVITSEYQPTQRNLSGMCAFRQHALTA
jgi:sporulation protein YlmC with PRC-barrel domain